jgi:hypothetical protein
MSRGMIDVESGAKTTLKLALDIGLDGVNGRYLDEHGDERQASLVARDEGLQEALWAASERWVAQGPPP